MRHTLALLVLGLSAASCAPAHRATPWQDVREMTPSFLAGAHAADPSLALDAHGRIALSWVTRDSLGADAWLAVSADSGGHWSQPVRLNTAEHQVTSYAESRPVLAWGRDGLLAAAWAATRAGNRGCRRHRRARERRRRARVGTGEHRQRRSERPHLDLSRLHGDRRAARRAPIRGVGGWPRFGRPGAGAGARRDLLEYQQPTAARRGAASRGWRVMSARAAASP